MCQMTCLVRTYPMVYCPYHVRASSNLKGVQNSVPDAPAEYFSTRPALSPNALPA